MSTIIKFNPVRAVDGNGEPVPGALARFFVTGTSTPITVFQDAGQTTPHPSPLVANAAGVFPAVYRNGATLKVEVRTPGGVMLPGFPIDPAFAVDTTGVGASGVSFNPTAEVPVTNVQAAIERVQDNLVAPLLAGGVGVTGNAPVLANFNATNTASGFYRFTDTATGDLPSGLSGETGVAYFLRETANTGWQFAGRKDADGLWFRRLLAGTWQTWRRVIDGSLAADQATWNTGTDTVERPISPAKLAGTIEDKLNVTGSAPMFACRAWVNFDGTTTPPTIRASGNVSSVTRNGTGDYTVNFATALPDANYVMSGTCKGKNTGAFSAYIYQRSDHTKTTSQYRLISGDTGGPYDAATVDVAFFR